MSEGAKASNQIPITREAVKTLAIAIGVRQAARQLKLNENTVISWSNRDNWFADQAPKPPGPERIQSAIKPSDALITRLQEQKTETKLNLAEYAVGASNDAKIHPDKLKIAQDVRHVAAVASQVWPEEKQAENQFNLQMICSQAVVSVGDQATPEPPVHIEP